MKGHLTKINIKMILKLDLLQTVLKLARVKCKQTPPYWKWRILMSPDCSLYFMDIPKQSITYVHALALKHCPV